MLFRGLPKAKENDYYILDAGMWKTEKEYIDLGIREGWLILYRIIKLPNGTFDYYYRYPDNYKTE